MSRGLEPEVVHDGEEYFFEGKNLKRSTLYFQGKNPHKFRQRRRAQLRGS